ncbi:Uncharacterized protein ChrSV_3012 [Chromobacterium vaccinii]|nr:Uncharacterized protein ChrSW_3012 [Chromobacterium vaccinii]QND90469.1 Uncharacterized protein ChrSV_3012 [Chromobacterium vaccinii]
MNLDGLQLLILGLRRKMDQAQGENGKAKRKGRCLRAAVFWLLLHHGTIYY